MTTLGIVAEFNPTTEGHKYIIKKAHEQFPDATIVAIMSGDYTVRGEFAIFDKWTRAKSAVDAGVDIVLELPAIYSLNGATVFSKESVRILSETGIIAQIFFGAEHADKNFLASAAKFISEKRKVLEKFDDKISYNIFLREEIREKFGIYPESNDLLAIEYIENLPKEIGFFPIGRVVSDYNSTELTGFSASPIREKIKSEGGVLFNANDKIFSSILIAAINGEFENLDDSDVTRIQTAAFNSKNFDEFIENAYHKRLSRSRIKRETLKAVIGMKNIDYINHKDTKFIRPLAASEKGIENLLEIKNKDALILKYADIKKVPEKSRELFYLNEKFTEIYHAFYDRERFTDRTRNIFTNKA